jgi:hypothetical protein
VGVCHAILFGRENITTHKKAKEEKRKKKKKANLVVFLAKETVKKILCSLSEATWVCKGDSQKKKKEKKTIPTFFFAVSTIVFGPPT